MLTNATRTLNNNILSFMPIDTVLYHLVLNSLAGKCRQRLGYLVKIERVQIQYSGRSRVASTAIDFTTAVAGSRRLASRPASAFERDGQVLTCRVIGS